jgi:hypothetical protein
MHLLNFGFRIVTRTEAVAPNRSPGSAVDFFIWVNASVFYRGSQDSSMRLRSFANSPEFFHLRAHSPNFRQANTSSCFSLFSRKFSTFFAYVLLPITIGYRCDNEKITLELGRHLGIVL